MSTQAEMTAAAARAMTEAVLQERVRRVIVELFGRGVLHYHTHRAQFSQAGFPDWIVVIPGGRIWVRELKRECVCKPGRKVCTYHPSAAQRAWLDALGARPGFDVGQHYHEPGVVRPSDLLSGRLAMELFELARAGRAMTEVVS